MKLAILNYSTGGVDIYEKLSKELLKLDSEEMVIKLGYRLDEVEFMFYENLQVNYL